MDCNEIRSKAADVLIECNVKQFPLDCFYILSHYDYKIYTYAQLKRKNIELYHMCIAYSEDAFRNGALKIIAYNETKPVVRIRFSLMHELGHHILEHKNDSPENEREANYFASNILAPRLAMYYTKSRLSEEIAGIFNISVQAAFYAVADFNEWADEVQRSGMLPHDRALYRQFYNSSYDGFVFHTEKCEFCGTILYNTMSAICSKGCSLRDQSASDLPGRSSLSQSDKDTLARLENKWLYDF